MNVEDILNAQTRGTGADIALVFEDQADEIGEEAPDYAAALRRASRMLWPFAVYAMSHDGDPTTGRWTFRLTPEEPHFGAVTLDVLPDGTTYVRDE